MTDLSVVFRDIRERIANAAKKSGRNPDSIKLVAASKTQPAETIKKAYDAGHRIFGENYAQEFEAKARELPTDVEWHFIGSLQRNKVKKVIAPVYMIHSVDNVALATEISKRAERPVKVLIEVNIAGEQSKSGAAETDVERLATEIAKLPKIELCGLMTMPPFFDDPDRARPYFAKLRELRDKLEKPLGAKLPELSMGMTGDFEAAIEEGATIVRIGTAIFGHRDNV